jgi:hypothetical protein
MNASESRFDHKLIEIKCMVELNSAGTHEPKLGDRSITPSIYFLVFWPPDSAVAVFDAAI